MVALKGFSALKKNLKRDITGLKSLSIALLGDSATQLLAQALKGTAYEANLNLEIWEADYNQIDSNVFDPASELYHRQFDLVILFKSTHKLLQKFNKLKPLDYNLLADNELLEIQALIKELRSKVSSPIIFYNYNEINDAVFGNYSLKTEHSFLFQLRKLNFKMMEYAVQAQDVHLIDLSSVQNLFGKKSFFDTTLYISTEIVINIEVIPNVAALTIDLILAVIGKFKKCVILDLDNTLWGGIIGDDGIENIQIGSLGIGKAFTEFQYWLKKLKNRGIILAVCSKNSEAVAKTPFEHHPDMVLKLDDIAVFVANWNNKVDNIHFIKELLNIGYDSMVFLDDNPFERNILRDGIPALTVPELPEDPADYLEYLYSLNLFETISLSEADDQRTVQYQKEAERTEIKKQFTNEADFLKNLEMVSKVEGFSNFNIPRVAQLSQRSNQFNLRTIRYSEGDIIGLNKNDNVFPFTFTLDDRFGKNGLVSIVILKSENSDTLFIDTWLMSCRVLKRGMENFTLNTIVDFAKENNIKFLKGEYIPTLKNSMVKDHYKNLGFQPQRNYWILDTSKYKDKQNYIIKENNG